jgi:hypothetical protein
MRALCGAIITAGALIGLGLASIGIGTRYASYPYLDSSGQPQHVFLSQMDKGLLTVLTLLVISLVIGLGIAFVGLAYHHHRRHLEMMHEHGGQRERVGL